MKYINIILIIMVFLNFKPDSDQTSSFDWVGPYQISNIDNNTVGAGTLNGMEGVSITIDQSGIAHTFWRERDAKNRFLIQYASFDGLNWSLPIDVISTEPNQVLGYMSSALDSSGMLYLVWGMSENLTSPVFISRVPVNDAYNAKKWSIPIRLDIAAHQVKLQIDSKGILHVIFSQLQDAEPGVYYIQSGDSGATWSYPILLDSNIINDHVPLSLQLDLDINDGLHAVWYYYSSTVSGDWVRYTNSLDGGKYWTSPITIDRIGFASDKVLTFAGPVMGIHDDTILVIWAGGRDLNYRNYRYSTDRGMTWSQPIRIFGSLNGQAGDGLVADSSGRFHFFGQIRYPEGIWQADWFNERWTIPSLIYLMTQTSNIPLGDRLNVHDTHPAIVGGNVLLLMFFNRSAYGGKEPLYAMHRVLGDIPAITRSDVQEIIVKPEVQGSEIPELDPPDLPLEYLNREETQLPTDWHIYEKPVGQMTTSVSVLLGILIPIIFIIIFFLFFQAGRKKR